MGGFGGGFDVDSIRAHHDDQRAKRIADLEDAYDAVGAKIDKAEPGSAKFDRLHAEADALLQRIHDEKSGR